MKRNPEIGEVWWIKNNNLQFASTVIENEDLLVFDLE
jgi:hypothetical protein